MKKGIECGKDEITSLEVGLLDYRLGRASCIM